MPKLRRENSAMQPLQGNKQHIRVQEMRV